MKEYYRVSARIDLDAIVWNMERTREKISEQTKIMAVIKADGYGHGAVVVARAIRHVADAYGVATLEEGLELRQAGIRKPVLILGPVPRQVYSEAIMQGLSLTVTNYDMAKCLSQEAGKAGKMAHIHVKVDTGMGRIGFLPGEESLAEIQQIARLPDVELEGIFTHFATADENEKDRAYKQLSRFLSFTGQLEERGVTFFVRHAANSAAIMEMPEAHLDMVRSGITTYGLYPSDQVAKDQLKIRPAMSLVSQVIYKKVLGPGCGIGYGSSFVTGRETTVATIPVGYGDGYPRALSNKGRVLIHGKSAPILGRVCMDQMMVDVTDIPMVQEGDVVTLLGKDGQEEITAEELATGEDSFHYEILCGIGKRVPREFYQWGKRVGTLDYFNCLDATLEYEQECKYMQK